MNKDIVKKFLEIIHNKKNVNKNEVVFVADHVKPRMVKMGYALKKCGFKIVLLLNKQNRLQIDKSDVQYYDDIDFFDRKDDVYIKCLLHSPIVYHLFSETYVSEWAEYLIQNKAKLGKIVYDQYDIYRGFVTNQLDDIGKREKYCLENADGLCCRMFETQYLKHKFHYHFNGKRILFFDYCWNRYNFTSFPQEECRSLKFVYGGRLLARPAINVERYKIELNGFDYIAKTIQKNNADFVIIPSSSCKGSWYSAYRALEKKYNCLVIKEPMNFEKLLQYESHMDYGIDCVELEEDIVAYCEQENSFNIRAKNQYYATNKYFDYLDAGIVPIYGRKGELFGSYLARMGGAVRCSLEEMPDKMEELRINCEENKKKACKAREVLSIDNQINRLIAFYREI